MRKKKVIIIIVIILMIGGGGLAYKHFTKEKKNEPSYSQLTGNEVSEDVAKRPILGIMLENSKEARPQTGLDAAGIVFEGVTEGGITRYLALYQEDMPKDVGPARSLRPHFLNWAMGFDASIAHVGGSSEALELAEERDAKSLNQFKYSEPYYRDDSRRAPHNMYAKTEDLQELQKDQSHEKSDFNDIPRSQDQPTQTPQAEKITINFSSSLYQAQFRYDTVSNSYTRYLAGEPHIDKATDKPITVKNLIVIRTDPQPNGVDAIGSGEAVVFKDGAATEVRWEKSNYNSRIIILDNQNNEVALNRGDTWIAALDEGKQLTY